MDEPRIDLNLAAVFAALLQERHVGRAAERLGLSQPAVSHALGRLRAQTGDILFERHARGVRPTPRAEELAARLLPALATLRASLAPPPRFEPAQAHRTITIGASDYADLTVLPAAMARLRAEAPGIALRLRAMRRTEAADVLRRREVELAIGPLDALPEGAQAVPLFDERFVLIARTGHPALQTPMTPEAFAALPHLLVSPEGEGAGPVDRALRLRGLARQVALRVPHFLSAPFIVGGSDLVAVLPARIAQHLGAAAGIACHPIPLELAPWAVGIALPESAGADPCVSWLAGLIRESVEPASFAAPAFAVEAAQPPAAESLPR